MPAGLLSGFQASRWLEFTVPKRHFTMSHKAKERGPGHRCPLSDRQRADLDLYSFLSCLFLDMEQSRCQKGVPSIC